ncbi:MAG: hypothetical protein WBB01_19860 [Phormidesmis sp.]
MNKRSPCGNCPFRTDVDFRLRAGKVQSILTALGGDGDFPCHKTIKTTGNPPGQDKGCIGAAIFLEHIRPGGMRANFAFRLREGFLEEFHRDELDMSAAVFTDEETFVAAKTKPWQ